MYFDIYWHDTFRILANNRILGFIFWAVTMSLFFCGCKLKANQHNITGIQAFQSGQVSQAINEFQRALTVDPQNANAYYNLAASYQALGKQTKNKTWLDQSEQLYRQCISLDDQHVDAHRGLSALLIETGQEKYAFDLLNAWRQRHPGQTDPLIELARLYQEYGDSRRSSDLLADALKLNSNSTRALKALGHVRDSQGQYQLALENYIRVLQIDPQQADIAQRVTELQNRLANLPAGTTETAPARYGSVDPYSSK